MSDFEQCLNQLQLDLILFLVSFSCELGQIMIRYDFLEASLNDFEQYSNWLQLDLLQLFGNVSWDK